MTSFPSPERVSLARSTGRSVFRSQTAGRSTSQHGTRSHPHIQAGIGSQSSIQFNTVVRRTPLIDDNGLRARLRVRRATMTLRRLLGLLILLLARLFKRRK